MLEGKSAFPNSSIDKRAVCDGMGRVVDRKNEPLITVCDI